MSTKYLDYTGLSYFWGKIKAYVASLLSSKADDSDVVHLAGTETVSGAKTFSSTVVLSRTTDADGTKDNQPALRIGAISGQHLEFDGNEILSKTSATAIGELWLNTQGGNVYVKGFGADHLVAIGGSKGSATLPVYTDANGSITACGSSLDVDVTGNAATATKLATARTISAGDLEFQGTASFDGSGNVDLDITQHRCLAIIGNRNNYPYHRIAYIPTVTGSWNDRSLTLLVSKDYKGGGYGICRIIFRTNGVSSSQAAQCNVQWLVRSSEISADTIQVGFVNTSGASYLDVFYKSYGTYHSAVCRVLAHGNGRGSVGRGFTIIDTSREVNNTTSSDALTSVEVYTSIAAAGTALHDAEYTSIIVAEDAGVAGKASADASGNVITDTYAVDSGVVHLAGAETVTGTKTFSSTISGSVSGSAASLSVTAALGSDYEMDAADFGDEKCCVYSVTSFKDGTTSAPRLNTGDYTLLRLYHGSANYAKFLCMSPREQRAYIGHFSNGVWQGWDELCCAGGNFRFSAGTTISRQTDDSGTFLIGGSDAASNASLVVYGGEHESFAGFFVLTAGTSSSGPVLLTGKPDGTLVWNNADITGDVHATGNETIGGTKTFTSMISGDIDGNAATATKLATARTITLGSDLSGSASFDGSSDITITATVADDSHNHVISNVDGLQTALDAKAADSGVVHLTGDETVAGAKTFSNTVLLGSGAEVLATGMRKQIDTSVLSLGGGSAFSTANGARIEVYGSSQASTPGIVRFYTGKVSGSYSTLLASPDGSLTWDGQAIQTSSDERLKTPLSIVPDEVLDAWEAVEWGQFRYLDAVERKGADARLHLGLIAQRVQAVFAERGLDACQYGILCHEEREANGEEPAVDLWMVRYEEALAMEAVCQRRRADRLEARIAALEEKLNG